MYYEKWGFMLIFWNLAGVPMTYCHCTLYLAYQEPSSYHWSPYTLTTLITLYLFIYWIWDTTNSQKNAFRHQERGNLVARKTFPQLPWQVVKNPKIIRTESGDAILADGWCKYYMQAYFHNLKLLQLRSYTDKYKMAMLEKSTTPVTFSLLLLGDLSPASIVHFRGSIPPFSRA